ncbi:MAG: hypothetical protein V3W52_16640 [Syntrophobacteria bacterium]
MCNKKMIRQVLVLAAMAILVLAISALAADQKPLLQTELPQPDVPEPQFFCGYCHILTYPSVVQKGYDLWQKGKHKDVGCVECHYPPRETATHDQARAATDATKIKHLPMKAPERFAYLPLGGGSVRTRPRIVDASCMTANCHGKPDDKFKTKKIKFTEKVSFTHKPHFDKKNQIEGMQLNCTNCHQHNTEKKKFEVSKASCNLCHFTNVKFNEGRSKCELCHKLPEKPIQTSGEKPITHEMLKKAKVTCNGCHFDLIQASGGAAYEAFFEKGELKTALVLGAGRTKKENCLACHDQVKELKEADNKKLMHQKHVTIKNARCLDCHQPIKHVKAKADAKDPIHDQVMLDACTACHADPHRYQRLLAAGPKREGVSSSPDPMYKARTNCLGCHLEQKFTEKGQRVLIASGKSCVRCHTKEHNKMLKDWKTELAKEVKYTKEVEQQALKALAKHKPKLTKEKLAEFREMLKQGSEDLKIVQFGNGVHNKKYSMMLLDAALTNFEDLLDELGEGE